MRLRFLLFLLVVLIPAGASSQQRPSGAVVNLSEGASATGQTSGVEVQAHADGKGIFVTYISVDVAASSKVYCFTIDSSTTLDTTISVVTPLFAYGPSALTSVVRVGKNDAGVLPAEGCFAQYYLPFFTSRHPIYVPAGKIFTARPFAVDTAIDVTVGFREAQR